MNYNDYMKMTCVYEKKLGLDDDTQMLKYGNPTSMKCFSYGKNIFIRGTDSNAIVSAKVYTLSSPVNVGDKIDGQVIKSVNNVPDFDGSMVLFEALTWFD